MGSPRRKAHLPGGERARGWRAGLFVPLLSAKVTLVHRRLWPALVSVGESRAPWQVDPLTPRAVELLAEVDRTGRVRASGPSSKALARALLVHAEQVHTAGGSHATELVSLAGGPERAGDPRAARGGHRAPGARGGRRGPRRGLGASLGSRPAGLTQPSRRSSRACCGRGELPALRTGPLRRLGDQLPVALREHALASRRCCPRGPRGRCRPSPRRARPSGAGAAPPRRPSRCCPPAATPIMKSSARSDAPSAPGTPSTKS